jgi:SPP1 family predicted phage head-tail adaptor
LREQITFEKRHTGVSGGTIRDEFVPAFSVRAKISVASTRDADRIAYLGEQTLYMIQIWFRTDIENEMRIRWRDKTFYIYGEPYDPDMERETLMIGCVEHS